MEILVMALMRKTVTTADVYKALLRMPGTVMGAFPFFILLTLSFYLCGNRHSTTKGLAGVGMHSKLWS